MRVRIRVRIRVRLGVLLASRANTARLAFDAHVRVRVRVS